MKIEFCFYAEDFFLLKSFIPFREYTRNINEFIKININIERNDEF
jgi:hypothetical protein